MSIENIISKVQKLLALSKSSNANEAAAAANAANKLIDQYRLSVADLSEDSAEIDPMMEDSGVVYETGRIVPWKQSLVVTLARHYGCATFISAVYPMGRKVSRFKLVGRKSDIAIVNYMFSYLSAECARLCEKEAHGKGKVFANSYCSGFVAGIRQQLQESRKEAEKEATGTAIVAINNRQKEASEFMYKLHNLKSSKGHSSAQTDFRAFNAGLQQGRNTHLGAGLKAANNTGVRLLGS
jgi:hypothetical protein